MKKALITLLTLSLLVSACCPLLTKKEERVTETDSVQDGDVETQILVNQGRQTSAMVGDQTLSLLLEAESSSDIDGVEIAIIDLGQTFLVETSDPQGRYLPSLQIVQKGSVDHLNIQVPQIDAGQQWAVKKIGVMDVEPLITEFIGTSTLENLHTLLGDLDFDQGFAVFIPEEGIENEDLLLDVYMSYGQATIITIPSQNTSEKMHGLAAQPAQFGFVLAYTVVFVISMVAPLVLYIHAMEHFTVPDFIGEREIPIDILYQYDFDYEIITTTCSSQEEIGTFVDQTPSPGTEINAYEEKIILFKCEELASEGPGPSSGERRTNSLDGASLVFVPAGAFTMGSDTGQERELPVHQVQVDSFWIYETEVTHAMYQQCVQSGGCSPPYDPRYYNDASFAQHPVVFVSWYDAADYCSWAGGRLPTEAEWEKAARGTDGRTYPWGEALSCNLADYKGCGGKTSPVGSYPQGASPYGALDMGGNVWEWTSSCFADYPYNASDGRENPGADCDRVLRGGAWDYDGDRYARTTDRLKSPPMASANFALDDFGFRCVESP